MTTDSSIPRRANKGNALLWTGQALLAALFLFAAVAKLTMPAEALAKVGLPVAFLRFIAVAELCGAIGLVLPGLLRIRRGLTPIAAACLVVIMIGATALTAATQGAAPALFPLAVGVLLIFVARGRRDWLRELHSGTELRTGRNVQAH
jgi:DoxX-like protein